MHKPHLTHLLSALFLLLPALEGNTCTNIIITKGPLSQPFDPEVPRIRADLQELPHHPPHRRRKGRIRLRPQGNILPSP